MCALLLTLRNNIRININKNFRLRFPTLSYFLYEFILRCDFIIKKYITRPVVL